MDILVALGMYALLSIWFRQTFFSGLLRKHMVFFGVKKWPASDCVSWQATPERIRLPDIAVIFLK